MADATPGQFSDPVITDETLRPFDVDRVNPSDIVGIGIHKSNARRGYEVGQLVHECGGIPIFGGTHANIYLEEPCRLGNATAVVRGDGDQVWASVLSDCIRGQIQPLYEGRTIAASDFATARWDLRPQRSYMWASVHTGRGYPKHRPFCSVWRTDGQLPRRRAVNAVIEEILALRRRGYRFIGRLCRPLFSARKVPHLQAPSC